MAKKVEVVGLDNQNCRCSRAIMSILQHHAPNMKVVVTNEEGKEEEAELFELELTGTEIRIKRKAGDSGHEN